MRAQADGLWSGWVSFNAIQGNLIIGSSSDDALSSGAGNHILEGLNGDDILSSTSSNNLLYSGAGNSLLTGGSGNDLFVGGPGNETILLGQGADVIDFNVGDGQDTIVDAGANQDSTLSLGGAVQYGDLAFSQSGNDLILTAGSTDQISFKDWYTDSTNHSVANLQVITGAMSGYDPDSSDVLLNKKIEQFDFAGLVNRFDQARAADSNITSWQLTNALLDMHLSGSDTEAYGGDLAYQYGINGSLAGISANAAASTLADPRFNVAQQTLLPPDKLQAGAVKLA